MSSFNLVYFGSPKFSADILRFIHQNLSFLELSAVVTQPDRPQGGQGPTPSPVAQTAQDLKLPVFKPHSLDKDNLQHLKLLKPDLFLVVAYGQILPPSWLDTPSLATLNLHFSLLPRYRGALCVQSAIRNQDQTTGVTLMKMDKKLDHGPLISQISQKISSYDNVHTLTQKLKAKAKTLLETTLPLYLKFTQDPRFQPPPPSHPDLSLYLPPEKQDHSQATYTPPVSQNSHQNAFISWPEISAALKGKNAAQIHALIRSLNPQPGAWTKIPTNQGDLKAKLIKTALENSRLVIDKLQLPGKQPILWQQFTAGHQVKN